jgi:SAM-dependent methyltransferase
MRCPICSGSPRPLFVKNGFEILECTACGHQMAEPDDWPTHVEQTYGDSYFTGGGAGYSDYLSEGPLLRAAGRRYGRLLARHTEIGRILDVGAAAGFVLKGFEDCGWRCTGIEPNVTMARYAQEVLGIRVVAGDLETARLDETFDVVSIIQVIAHFREPRKAMQIISRLVRPGGYVLIESWNRASLTARAFGRAWHEYSPPSVLHWFSRDGLRQLGEAAGLLPVTHGRPLKMLDGAHAKSLLKYKLSSRPATAAVSKLVDLIPERLPIIYPFDDPIWVLLRKPPTTPRPG